MTRFKKLLTLLASPVFAQALLRYRVAAAVEHMPALRQLRCKTVVDIGAHSGQFALVARARFPDSRIIAFEPLPEPARRFRRLFAKDVRVNLYQVAIGPVVAVQKMHVSAKDDSSSLLPIGELQVQIFRGTYESTTVEVAVGPLERYVDPRDITPPALLKVDVQGYELQALYGCESLLSLFDVVYCECSFVELYHTQPLAADVLSWLNHRGFVLRGVYNVTYHPVWGCVQADFLFIRRRTERRLMREEGRCFS
ncbi:MAG: hypothetical protein KatS3mg082_3001 [Nitrospiraceae bacterium]|nr:MAG: hypothetical protein KatS3mg082_3001 [Nitrospiraceae bacterium]